MLVRYQAHHPELRPSKVLWDIKGYTAAEKVGCRAVLSSEAKNSCDVGVITSVGRMMTEYHRIVAGAPTDQIYKASNRHVKMHLRITPARRRTSRLTPTGVITVPNDDSDLSPTKNKAPTPSLKAPPVAAAPTVGGSTGNGVQVAMMPSPGPMMGNVAGMHPFSYYNPMGWGQTFGMPGMVASPLVVPGVTPGSTPGGTAQLPGASSTGKGKQLSFKGGSPKKGKKEDKRAKKAMKKHTKSFKNAINRAVHKARGHLSDEQMEDAYADVSSMFPPMKLKDSSSDSDSSSDAV